ncbi:hypothetical protein GQR58_006905 [Nymphon striatum]|nr:hypothetical protein GQR58_006905 [Nymphon striatum]
MRLTTNYYLVNLAIADILIAAFCMSIHLIKELSSHSYILGTLVCKTDASFKVRIGWKELSIERTGDLDGRPLLSSGPIWAVDDDDDEVKINNLAYLFLIKCLKKSTFTSQLIEINACVGRTIVKERNNFLWLMKLQMPTEKGNSSSDGK